VINYGKQRTTKKRSEKNEEKKEKREKINKLVFSKAPR